MAVKLVGVKPGDMVFCSDMTFDATVNPVVYEGGVPVFIDTEYDTWNMDPNALEKAFELYPDVQVVVFAHLYGTPGKVDEIRGICAKHNAVIIEDAAESLGATYKGVQTGTFGSYNAISLMEIKSSRDRPAVCCLPMIRRRRTRSENGPLRRGNRRRGTSMRSWVITTA